MRRVTFGNMSSRSQNLVLPEGTSTLIRNLINERTGMFFDNGKSDLLIDKLSPLVIERGFSSYLDYYYLLKYDASAPVEWQNVMNALSVQETYFWREIDQVRALVQTLVPQWQLAKPSSTLRIWSAACATGEEPLTIAIALNEAGWFERAPIEILASDASTKAIERAVQGVYQRARFSKLAGPSARTLFRAGWFRLARKKRHTFTHQVGHCKLDGRKPDRAAGIRRLYFLS